MCHSFFSNIYGYVAWAWKTYHGLDHLRLLLLLLLLHVLLLQLDISIRYCQVIFHPSPPKHSIFQLDKIPVLMLDGPNRITCSWATRTGSCCCCCCWAAAWKGGTITLDLSRLCLFSIKPPSWGCLKTWTSSTHQVGGVDDVRVPVAGHAVIRVNYGAGRVWNTLKIIGRNVFNQQDRQPWLSECCCVKVSIWF